MQTSKMKAVTVLYIYTVFYYIFVDATRGQDASHKNKFELKGSSAVFQINKVEKSKTSHSKRLLSVKNMLNDPHLEEFSFIHPGSPKFSKKHYTGLPNIPARQMAIIKLFTGTKSVRKLFKVKVKTPKWLKSQKKFRTTLLFPRVKSSMNEKCQWDLKTGKLKLMIYIPKNCLQSIKDIYEQFLTNSNVLGFLLPRHSRIDKILARKLLTKFLLINYGKRMRNWLEKFAAGKEKIRLILPKRKWQTTSIINYS